MTAFIAEASRLTDAGFPPALSAPFVGSRAGLPGFDAEGLCVSGCPGCRNFRNSVREAQAAEQASIAAEDQKVIDFEREEEHAADAAVELEDHLNLLPVTRLSGLARDALNNAIGLAHMAFDEARENGMVLVRPDDPYEDFFASIFGDDSVFIDDSDDLPEFPY